MTPPTLTPTDCLRGAGPAISNPVHYRFRDRPSLLRAQLNNKVTLRTKEDAMAEKADAGAQIDAYIAGLEPPFAAAITHLRKVVRAAAPEAEEVITYAMPGIALHGPLVSYFAFKKHCSFFPMGNAVFVGMADEIAPWRISKGTMQFPPDALPPDALITRMVEARLAENAAKAAERQAKRGKGSGA
jgi:uncharacterized protein YdhG (YjbR/CyaY superfamily)